MDKYELKNDVNVITVTARSFPDGILDAFRKLEAVIPGVAQRVFYGISCPDEQGTIIYKAAVSEITDGEALNYGFEKFVITKGIYLVKTIQNWRKDIPAIGMAFEQLLKSPELDLSFPCVECYNNMDEVACMVRLDPRK